MRLIFTIFDEIDKFGKINWTLSIKSLKKIREKKSENTAAFNFLNNFHFNFTKKIRKNFIDIT